MCMCRCFAANKGGTKHSNTYTTRRDITLIRYVRCGALGCFGVFCFVVGVVVAVLCVQHYSTLVQCVFGGRIGNNACGEVVACTNKNKHSLPSHPKGHRTNPGTEAEPQQIVTQGYSHAYSTTFHS